MDAFLELSMIPLEASGHRKPCLSASIAMIVQDRYPTCVWVTRVRTAAAVTRPTWTKATHDSAWACSGLGYSSRDASWSMPQLAGRRGSSSTQCSSLDVYLSIRWCVVVPDSSWMTGYVKAHVRKPQPPCVAKLP